VQSIRATLTAMVEGPHYCQKIAKWHKYWLRSKTVSILYDLSWQCWRGSAIPYLAAGVTAYERVAADRHHWEDVAASVVLTEAIVYLTTDMFDENMMITLTFDNGFGIAIFKRF